MASPQGPRSRGRRRRSRRNRHRHPVLRGSFPAAEPSEPDTCTCRLPAWSDPDLPRRRSSLFSRAGRNALWAPASRRQGAKTAATSPRPHRAPVTATHGRARGQGGGTRGGAGPRLSPAAAERTVLYLQAPRENVCGSGSGRGVCGTACRAPSRASRARRRSRRPSRAPPPRGDAAAPSRGAQPFRAEPSAACSARAQAQRAPRLPPSRRKPDNQLWRRMASAPACHAPKEIRGAGKAGRGSSISLHAARTEQTAGPPPCMAEEAPPPLAHCRQSLLLGHQKSSY